MGRFLDLVDRKLSPLADKLASNRFLKSIANGMMLLMPVTMVASIYSMLASVLGLIFDLSASVSAAILMPYNLLYGALALLVALTVSYKHAEQYGMSSINVSLTSVLTFLVVAAPYNGGFDSSFLGYAGIFTAVIVALLSVELERFLLKHKISIKMPDSVPPMVSQSFENLVPMFIIFGVFYGASVLAQKLSGGLIIPQLINKVVMPALTGADTLGFNFAIHFLMQLFYWFGLHGYSVVAGVFLPISTTMLAANVDAWAAGQPLPYASAAGLAGGPFNFVLPFMLLAFCKAQRNKAMGKASIVPGIFGISEPWLFGTPVMLNPILGIPFILYKPITMTLTVAVIKMGLRNAVHMEAANIPGLIVPVTTFIAADYDWRVFLWWAVCIAVTVLVFLPFLVVWDRKCLREEKEQAEATEE